MLPSVHKLLYAVFLHLHIFHEPVFKKKKLLFDPFNLKTGICKHCFVVQPLQDPLMCSSTVKILLIAIYVSMMKENKTFRRLFLWAAYRRLCGDFYEL